MGGIDCAIDSKKRKLDVGQALKLRLKGYDEPTIAGKFNVSTQAVNQALKPFKPFLNNPEIIQAYENNKPDILSAAELILLSDILDSKKREKATQGNAAYAFDKIATHNRLERGLSTENVAYSGIMLKIDDRSSEIVRLKQLLNIHEVGDNDQDMTDITPDNDDVHPPVMGDNDHS